MKLKILLGAFCFFTLTFGVDSDGLEFEELEKLPKLQENKELSVAEKNFQDWLEKRAQKSNQDFEHYLSKYFPKVFSVRERFFLKMTPEGVADGFKEIIEMISCKPWLYLEQLFKQISKILTTEERKKWKESGYDFDSLPKKFDNKNAKKWLDSGGVFWEFIADQLCFYSEFIDCAKVDLETNVIFFKKNDINWEKFSDFKSFEKDDVDKSENLKECWNKKGIQVYYDFYALCFDYWAKLFLEAILQKDLDLAYRYQSDLKIIMNKLTGSSYESERQEDMKNYRGLLEILKQKNKNDSADEKGYGQYFEELMDFWDN